jgi:rod shape-determining protein MreD
LIVWTIVLMLAETAIVPWLVPSGWSERLLPHFAFIMTMFAAFFGGRHKAFAFGLGFGLLQDSLNYGHLLGAYGFGMGLIGYLAGLVSEHRKMTIPYLIGMMALGGGLLDSLVFFAYKMFRLTHLTYGYVFYWQIAPTLLLQLFVALALYSPVRRFLVKASLSSSSEDNSA